MNIAALLWPQTGRCRSLRASARGLRSFGCSRVKSQGRVVRRLCVARELTKQFEEYRIGLGAGIVYVENLTSALYLDKQVDVDRYLLAMERLSIVAYEPQETPRILDEIIRQLEAADEE